MKRYIRTSESNNATQINVEVLIEFDDKQDIAAASYKGFNIPDGQPISGLLDAVVDSQALADYRSFMESVENLLTDYYDLDIYYKNNSEWNSYYFGLLAKSSDGELLLDFNFTLRLSTHDPHRTDQSQKHKKEQKAALLKATGGKKTKPITKSIIINGEQYDSYEEAYIAVDNIVENVVEILKRRLHR